MRPISNQKVITAIIIDINFNFENETREKNNA